MTLSVANSEYFPGIEAELSCFREDEPVWNALNLLKDFIKDTISPNLPDFITPGMPVERHAALIDGDWIDTGFTVVCTPETKGKFQVYADGNLMPGAALVCAGALFASRDVQIGPGAIVEAGALVKGPAIIGEHTEVRQGAYLRGDCLIGQKCVVGHTTEVKHSIFLNGAKAGHFAYVGDSILGRDVNMGAGTKLANLKFGPGTVSVMVNNQRIDTGRRKIGAILGDNVQTGCNSVTNPGTVVGHNSLIAPNTTVSPGIYSPRSIIR